MLVILWSFFTQSQLRTAPGRQVFTSLVWINYFFITVGAIGYFATSITEEKEEQTLGLMRMAGISPLGLLLGKSASRLWMALVLIAVQFPFTLLSVTLGGVTQRQIFASYVSLGAYTFFLSGVGTLCSVVSRRSMRAVIYMFLFVVGLVLLTPILAIARDLAGGYSPQVEEAVDRVVGWIGAVSFQDRINGVLTITFDDPVFERHFVASVVAGSFCFLLAWLCFDFFANRHVDQSPTQFTKAIRKSPVFRAPRVWSLPLHWKDFYFSCGGLWGWMLRLAMIIGFTMLFYLPTIMYAPGSFTYKDRVEVLGGYLMTTSVTFAMVELTIQSMRFLGAEHSGKTLPMLAMLPQSSASTLYSKLCGYLIGILPAVGTFFFGMLLIPNGFADFMHEILTEPEAFLSFGFAVQLFFVFLHLNTLLSTWIKWAAAPVSFGILMMTNMCCLGIIFQGGPSSATGFLFIMNAICMFGIGGLQVLIAERYVELASR